MQKYRKTLTSLSSTGIIAVAITLTGCASGSVSVSAKATYKCTETAGQPSACSGQVSAGISWTSGSTNTVTNSIATLSSGSYYVKFNTLNVTVVNGTYNADLEIKNSSNTIVASKQVSFYVSSNIGYLSDPTSDQQWVASNIQSGDTVSISYPKVPFKVTNTSASSGSITANYYYDSNVVASASSSFSLSTTTCNQNLGRQTCVKQP